MEKQQRLLLKKYFHLLLRWKLLLIILLLISLPVGLVYYVKTPKVYMASSLLSYQQQSVSPNTMSPDVKSRIQDIVSTLTQIVTSRTNLENLITSLNLYEGARERLPMEDVIDMMRHHINIQPSRRGDTFSISFSGGDPAKVVKVTNALAAKFIEENLKYREERASETSAYTSNELEMAKSTMDAKEAAMRDYKLKYYNEMPDQREANVSRLVSLQEQYQGMQLSILELERTKVMIQEQIAIRKKTIAAEAAALAAAIPEGAVSSPESDFTSSLEHLRKMRMYLESLKIKYTENHPEVKRTQKIIRKLEEEFQATDEDSGLAKGKPGKSRKKVSPLDKDLLGFQTQLMNTSFKIETMEAEKEQLSGKISKYEEWIAATPEREAQWSSIIREYGQLKSHYDSLVGQDLQAKSMLNLERRQKGSQFKVEDPARFPEKPIKPDFVKIMALCVAAGMGFGVGGILVIDFLDGSFRDPDEIEAYLGVPVISTIALIPTDREDTKSRIVNIGSVLVVVIGVVMVLALFWYAWSRGKIVF